MQTFSALFQFSFVVVVLLSSVADAVLVCVFVCVCVSFNLIPFLYNNFGITFDFYIHIVIEFTTHRAQPKDTFCFCFVCVCVCRGHCTSILLVCFVCVCDQFSSVHLV